MVVTYQSKSPEIKPEFQSNSAKFGHRDKILSFFVSFLFISTFLFLLANEFISNSTIDNILVNLEIYVVLLVSILFFIYEIYRIIFLEKPFLPLNTQNPNSNYSGILRSKFFQYFIATGFIVITVLLCYVYVKILKNFV